MDIVIMREKIPLFHLIDEATVADILTLPLSYRWPLSHKWPCDTLFWWLEKNRCYSVKSGYCLGLLGHSNRDDSAVVADSRFWSSLWNVEGPPKLRHFLWRACKGSLATKHTLFQRYCTPSSLCDMCNNEPETFLHAIIDCPKVHPMWNVHTAKQLIQYAPRMNVPDFMECILGHALKDTLSSIFATMWAAWFFRNKQVFEDFDGDQLNIARSFNKMVDDYKLYNTSTTVSLQPRFLHYQSWQPPSRGWVKVNFDAYVADGAVRGLGVIIRDNEGKILVAGVRRIKARWPVDVSEAAAAMFSLQVASWYDCENIFLEGDSLSLISTIHDKEHGRSPIHLLYDCIFDLCSSFYGFSCSFVKRDGNSLAHFVARWDTDIAEEKICVEPFLQGLQTLADLDLC